MKPVTLLLPILPSIMAMPLASPTTTPATTLWQPAVGTTWQLVLSSTVKLDKTIEDFQVWDIDLFDQSAADVKALQARGRKVIAYFSAGTYENWRADAKQFKSSDLGKKLGDWPGEKWLNTKSSNVRNIMRKRLDLAVSKGFDGVDPDNVDAYDNKNGLGLTKADAVDYVLFLAKEAQARGLSIGLKNAGDIVPKVVSQMQWSVQEQSIEYDETDLYKPFITQGKPVFNVEYPKGDDASDPTMNTQQNVSNSQKKDVCDVGKANKFSTIIKNVVLDQWIQTC